ncbi:hypothetical protein LINPERHAP2_LOCUS32446 [Linum perenne]
MQKPGRSSWISSSLSYHCLLEP